MANSIPMKGCQLQIAHPSTVFVAVGQVQSLTGPSAEMGTRDVTHLGSTAKEFAPSIADAGEVSGTCVYYYTDAGQTAMQGLVVTPSTLNTTTQLTQFRIILPTTTKFFAFDGLVTKFDIVGGDAEGSMMADFTIKVSGAVTYPTTV